MPNIVKLEVTPSLGMNTALNPSNLPNGSQRQAYDACMREIDTIGKRPGSAPLTSTTLGSDITYLTTYTYDNSVNIGIAPSVIFAGGSVSEATLLAGTYYVRYTYVTAYGETNASPEASITTPQPGYIRVDAPAFPAGVSQINIYIGSAPNSGKLEGSTVNFTFYTNKALTGTIPYPTVNTTKKSESLYAASGATLYEYYNGALNAITMTDPFETPNVFGEAFKNSANTSALLLSDSGVYKHYNGTAVVKVTAAANDPGPAPPNDLAAINTRGVRFVWAYTNHVFLSDGSDTIWYSKRYEFDYFPSTQFFRFVRNNDYVTAAGVAFAGLCLIPMRRGWGILQGEVFDDGLVPNGFSANQYLNTTNGNISPRGISRITYPTNGSQTIAYLSDDGMHEIYDTGFISTGVRQYSTRSLMKDKLDFAKFGFTNEEKAAAVAHFDEDSNWLYLSISKVGVNYMFIYDTRNQEWYVWRVPWAVKALTKWQDTNYFGGFLRLLQSFSDDLFTDWNDFARTTGTTVDFDVYSGLLAFEFSGEGSYLDYYLVESQMWNLPSTLDVWVVYGTGKLEFIRAQDNQIFIWGVTAWGQGQYANLAYTDNVNNAKRLVLHKKAKYFQRRWRNNKDEPVTILREKFVGRVSGRS